MICIPAHKKNQAYSFELTSNDLREENKRMKRKQEKQEAANVDIFYCSAMSAILRKSFAVLILWYFLIKQKVQLIINTFYVLTT